MENLKSYLKEAKSVIATHKMFCANAVLCILVLVSISLVFKESKPKKQAKTEKRAKRPLKHNSFVVSHLKDHGHDYIVVENEHGIYYYHAAHCEMKDYGYE